MSVLGKKHCPPLFLKVKVLRVMVFNSTFNNISAISRRAVLLVEKTGVPGENHRPVASHGQSFKWSVPYLVNNLTL